MQTLSDEIVNILLGKVVKMLDQELQIVAGRRATSADRSAFASISPEASTSIDVTKMDEPVLKPQDPEPEGEEVGLLADTNNVPQFQRKVLSTRKKRWQLFGVEMSPDTIAIAMVYFVQGILGLSRLAVSYFLKDDLHLDPAEAALLQGLSALPWLIKPLYGFISDGVPLFGYRRRSYLVLCGLLGASSWFALATVVNNKWWIPWLSKEPEASPK